MTRDTKTTIIWGSAILGLIIYLTKKAGATEVYEKIDKIKTKDQQITKASEQIVEQKIQQKLVPQVVPKQQKMLKVQVTTSPISSTKLVTKSVPEPVAKSIFIPKQTSSSFINTENAGLQFEGGYVDIPFTDTLRTLQNFGIYIKFFDTSKGTEPCVLIDGFGNLKDNSIGFVLCRDNFQGKTYLVFRCGKTVIYAKPYTTHQWHTIYIDKGHNPKGGYEMRLFLDNKLIGYIHPPGKLIRMITSNNYTQMKSNHFGIRIGGAYEKEQPFYGIISTFKLYNNRFTAVVVDKTSMGGHYKISPNFQAKLIAKIA